MARSLPVELPDSDAVDKSMLPPELKEMARAAAKAFDITERLDRASYACVKPCAECPFSRTGTPDKAMYDPLRIIGQAHGPFMLPCHMPADYAEKQHAATAELPQCAGAAIYRSNVGVASRMPPALHVLPADTAAVFASPAELVASHYGCPMEHAEEAMRRNPPEQLLRQELGRTGVQLLGVRKPGSQ